MKPNFSILAVIILHFLFSSSVFSQNVHNEEGIFLDTLNVGPVELRLGITLMKDDTGNYTGSFNSIDQNSGDIPFDEVKIEGNHLLLVSKLGIQVEGNFDEKKLVINGEFRQGPGKFPVSFQRVDALPSIRRPQEPKPPYPYIEEEVSFENPAAGVKLAGTLTFPNGEGPYTAVVLITGSGPQNRNEEMLGHKPFLVLADMLTRNGIAVLRYDDRGVGSSTGDFGTASSADFAEDALAAVSYLKSRGEINPVRIGFVGHSEGGIIGPIAATQSDDIAFMVLLAGPAANLGDIVTYQRVAMARRNGAPEAYLEVYEKFLLAVNDLARKEISDDELKIEVRKMHAELPEAEISALGWNEQQIGGAAKLVTGNWWRYGLRHNPEKTLAGLKCPVLALLGEMDKQVPVEMNFKALQKALATGNHKNQVVVMPGVNHLFQTCTTGEESEYAKIEETMSPAVQDYVKNWIVQAY